MVLHCHNENVFILERKIFSAFESFQLDILLRIKKLKIN